MKITLLALVAAAALATLASAARADADATVSIACADGTTWVLDASSVDTLGPLLCDGAYVLVQDDAAAPLPTDPPAGDFDLDPNIAPDPELYSGEVRCPDGSVWAVPIGENFTCPDLFAGLRWA